MSGHPSTTWQDRDGTWMRRCSDCREVKRLERDFYGLRPAHPTIFQRYQYSCKGCQVVRTVAHKQRLLADPATRSTLLARNAEANRRRRAANPDLVREQSRKYREAMQLDPVRRARKLETQRIGYRLRRERAGLPFREGRTNGATMTEENDAWRLLPVAPLAKLVRRIVAREQARVMAGGPSMPPVTVEEVCERLGVTDRTLRRWETDNSYADFDIADSVLTAEGLHFFDVWPAEEFPEVARVLGYAD